LRRLRRGRGLRLLGLGSWLKGRLGYEEFEFFFIGEKREGMDRKSDDYSAKIQHAYVMQLTQSTQDSPEQILLQHSHSRNDSRFSTRAQTMQLHVRADHGSCEFGIGSRACTAATNVLRYVVDLPWIC
jgi:hypothetical protein